MGFNNPEVSWAELERVLSGKPRDGTSLTGATPPGVPGDGGDSPAWSHKRPPYQLPDDLAAGAGPGVGTVPYAELHCHSNYSFLDGASHPEELVEQAVRLGLEAIALTDHDGMYGVVRFAEAAAKAGMRTVFGAELSLGLRAPQNGVPDPEGSHLLALARGPAGYRALCRTISTAQLRGKEKGRPIYHLEQIAADIAGHAVVLTGCRKGAVRRALVERGVPAAAAELSRLVELFGAEHVAVELTEHGLPTDTERNDALAALAADAGLPTVATNAVHYADPARFPLATALAAVRARRSLDEADGWLPAAPMAHLRSGAEMAARFDARYPGAVARAAALGRELSFELRLVAPELPPFDLDGRSETDQLRELTMLGAAIRYGSHAENPEAMETIKHELKIIEEKNFPGYFLIVHDIVSFCHKNNILCQGRGSAANSAVCYALGITAVDAVAHGLLFERFLSPARDGYPDIDLDIESGRREEVIQYVYEKYHRTHTAQVANVISYRPRSAVRDVAKALGFSPGQQDAWSKRIERWGPTVRKSGVAATASSNGAEPDVAVDDDGIPENVWALADQLLGFPRHLGIHSGGMVICDRPVSEVVPVEWARMADRTVVQWDKDDCAVAGLVKFDLLGLGMLTALHKMIDLVAEHHGRSIELEDLQPTDPAVYDMLCKADSVGVFQVESRAQIATLPRLRPRTFYDLVVEVALIRPGPIQGGSVHPYIRRRKGLEEATYDHPALEKALSKTLGVPLFQEQLMQIAVDVAGFSAAEADELRRAMGSKRSVERMNALRERFYAGMADNGITGEVAVKIFEKMMAFANFGFPESHSISFASLVYYSSWFKLYHPAAFCAALLNSQPMGFYSPQSLIADARRHGVVVRGPDVNSSKADATLEPVGDDAGADTDDRAIRLGLSSVRTVGDELAKAIEDERRANGRYADLPDFARRVQLTVPKAEALATAGAFGCFGIDRRAALWAAGVVASYRPSQLPGTEVGVKAPPLPGMTDAELTIADVWATGVSPDSHPIEHLRDQLHAEGAVRIAELTTVTDGARVRVGGLVTHRQRPATAGGVTFLNLEDESGMLNVVCSPGLWARYRTVAMGGSALVVRGRLERTNDTTNVLNLLADRLDRLELRVVVRSRDFR
ncbi:error-prone DNA polymerase [Pseudonocardia acaciae]|uniref:error-prone DNA polymerase n=1 Tax=Pseudonocardia acaciae TaxID=551276 RepID=UPI000491C39E|nr:error-prone DNA polymerase [Pseudonocardia acaciae]